MLLQMNRPYHKKYQKIRWKSRIGGKKIVFKMERPKFYFIFKIEVPKVLFSFYILLVFK